MPVQQALALRNEWKGVGTKGKPLMSRVNEATNQEDKGRQARTCADRLPSIALSSVTHRAGPSFVSSTVLQTAISPTRLIAGTNNGVF